MVGWWVGSFVKHGALPARGFRHLDVFHYFVRTPVWLFAEKPSWANKISKVDVLLAWFLARHLEDIRNKEIH
jgi:hypothetical protein